MKVIGLKYFMYLLFIFLSNRRLPIKINIKWDSPKYIGVIKGLYCFSAKEKAHTDESRPTLNPIDKHVNKFISVISFSFSISKYEFIAIIRNSVKPIAFIMSLLIILDIL